MMDDKANVGFIDTHAERNRGNDYLHEVDKKTRCKWPSILNF